MKRDAYWDSLKLLLMFCVLYGHLIQGFAPHGSFNCAMTNLVYLFHIPVFVFVSGRFSHIKNRKKYITGIWRLLETYLVFQAIRCFLPLLWHGGDDFITFLILPQWTLWYLLSLICWRLLVLFTPDVFLQRRPLVIIISTLVVSVLSGFIPIGEQFSIQRTLAFLPFFCMGYYSTRFDLKSMINKIPAVAAATILVLSFLLLYYLLNVNMMYIPIVNILTGRFIAYPPSFKQCGGCFSCFLPYSQDWLLCDLLLCRKYWHIGVHRPYLSTSITRSPYRQ